MVGQLEITSEAHADGLFQLGAQRGASHAVEEFVVVLDVLDRFLESVTENGGLRRMCRGNEDIPSWQSQNRRLEDADAHPVVKISNATLTSFT